MSSISEHKKEEIIEDEPEEEVPVGGGTEGEEDSFSMESHENLKGEILSQSRRWGIFIQFDVPHGNKGSTARLCPIRAYVNGSLFLSELCPTERDLSRVFPLGTKLMLDVERRIYSKKGSKEMDWIVTSLWKGESKDFTWSLEKEQSFLERIQRAKEHILDPAHEGEKMKEEEESKEVKEVKEVKETWFISNLNIPKYLPHPSVEGAVSNVVGKILSLNSAQGGVIKTIEKGLEVYFHRCRVYYSKESLKLSAGAELKSVFKEGEEVRLDYIENKDKDGNSYMDTEQKYVALVMYSKEGSTPNVPEIAFRKDPDEKYFIARIISFDEPIDETGVSSGIAEILRPTERNTNGYVKSTFKKMVNLDSSSVKKVKFNRKALYHIGAPLEKRIFSRGALTIPPTVKEDTLLTIKSLSQCNTRFLGREGMDYATYERIIQGRNKPYLKYFNGNEDCSEYVPARISELSFPPGKNEGVAKGFCILQAFFGFKPSEKSDLQYFIVLNEPCYVRLDEGNEDDDNGLKINDLWIGAPRSAFLKNADDEMSYDKFMESETHRIKFFLFLESHDLSLKDFDEVIKGKKASRKFLPLSRESNRGAVSGVIKVENGPLAGQYVTFHRKNTWVMGYNMLKADLTHIFQEGQKVNLEAEELPSKEASRGPIPYEYKYRATLVWTSKFRPRNDLERTTPEDKRSHDWLKKRNLDSEKFQQLVNGKLSIVNAQFAAKNGNNMLKYRDILELASGRVQPDGSVPPPVTPEQLPVLRHGPEAARICEAALSTTGPNDQRIMDIIRNDDNAQMAFHIHKALGFALEYYTSNNSSSSFSMNESYSSSSREGGNPQNPPFLNTNSSNNNNNSSSSGGGNYRMNGGAGGVRNNNKSFVNEQFQNFGSQQQSSTRSLSNGSGNNFNFQQQHQQQSHQHHHNYSSSGINNNHNSRSSVSSRGTKRQSSDGNSPGGGYSPGMKKSRGIGGLRSSGIRPLGGGNGGGGRGGMKNSRGGRGGRGGNSYRN
ncbi:unnamed protein product [Lepeophtheirus salmonis]|uniref:(salmon louse) hypothetical protein n=1 Tax=Lepeophtheirus salmonis TaxID=72036 RepID=A0A7R8CBK8_LEPSM|nr:unnamed protein product [Lepeophtheirus salmonis]CAF2759037.1 unnamed protein product [Lepeophtheirus salmonis]